MTTKAILNATVLKRTSGWEAVDGIDVIIDGECIAAIGPNAAAQWRAAETIDGSDLMLTPGLVNAHCHSAEVLARGRATSSGLSDWVASALVDIDTLSHEEIQMAVSLCAMDLIRSGVTSVVDHFRQMPAQIEAAQVAAAAWDALGLRATVALMLRDGVDQHGRVVDAPHAGDPPKTREILDLGCEWVSRQPPSSFVKFALGPSSPVRCTETLISGLADIARQFGSPLHMHVSETAQQASDARDLYGGQSAVEMLGRLGALGASTSLVHCVHLADEDFALISETGTTVVHCPVANLRLGSGIAAVSRLRDAGASLALATDGAASNDAQSITEVLKLSFLLSRLSNETDEWLSPDDILDMAFQPGMRAFTGQNNPLAGKLEVGAPADIAAFDLTDPVLVPANDLPAQFVLAGGCLRARHVWINGECRLANGVPLGVDLSMLSEAARMRQRRLLAAA
jgi:5-methylthioadenosine/S-adenosylhomocysteine deaminase